MAMYYVPVAVLSSWEMLGAMKRSKNSGLYWSESWKVLHKGQPLEGSMRMLYVKQVAHDLSVSQQ